MVDTIRSSNEAVVAAVHKEGARISNELPRIRAVKLAQAQRDAVADATAAAAHWSDVRDAAATMKLELAR